MAPIRVVIVLLLSLPAWAAETTVVRWDFARDFEGWHAAHHVRDMTAADGILRLSTTGHDAYIAVDGGRLPTAQAHVLRLRLRSDRPGQTQVYYTTTESSDAGAHPVPGVQVAGDNVWREYAVRMLGRDGWRGDLTMLRLDPVNPAADARVEIDWVALSTLPPMLQVERFAADLTRIAPQQRFRQRLVVRNVGGPMPPQAVQVTLQAAGATLASPPEQELGALSESGVAAATWTLLAGADGACRLRARIVDGSGAALADVASVVPLPAQQNGRQPTYHNGVVGITLHGGIEARLFARAGEGWKATALCRPLARLALAAPMEQTDVEFTRVRRWGDTVTLSAAATSRRLPVRLTLRLDNEFIHCRAELGGGGAAELLHFSGPTLLVAGTDKREALFCGVEYLNENEPSSRSDIIGRRFAPRTVPEAYWITAPVMAVQTDAGLSALMWKPTAEWAPGHALPAAAFASPNRLDEQDNHLMQLFVPGVGDGTEPNERMARRGHTLSATASIALESTLFTTTKAMDTIVAVEAWSRMAGLPAVPDSPHDATRTQAICMLGFRDTMREPGQGWTMHWGMGEQPARHAEFIQRLLVHALRTGDAGWLANTDLSVEKNLIDALGPLEHQAGQIPAQIALQRADGTWPYHETDELKRKCRELSAGESDTLGEADSTNVGVCAVSALPVLRHALHWGDAASLDCARKALEAMLAFRVPAGAQTWEVHKDIPDINAAGHACECFGIGFEIFGEQRYLDAAVYWARSGLSFIYLWEAPVTPPETTVLFNGIRGRRVAAFTKPASECYENPRRRIMPYASIPVLGTSFYVVRWYGHPVQWCGLVWAEAVLELLNAHADELPADTARLLRHVADGVLTSARWQQLDKPPYTGLLPDSWHPESNLACPAMIGPMRIHDTLNASLARPDWRRLATRVVRDETRRLHITSYGAIDNAAFANASLRFHARYLSGQPYEVAITPCPQPSQARVDGATTVQRYIADRRMFVITLAGIEQPQTIEIDFPPTR